MVINRYRVKALTYFLDELRNTHDDDGSLLEHSLILYRSMSNPLLAIPHTLNVPAERIGDSSTAYVTDVTVRTYTPHSRSLTQ